MELREGVSLYQYQENLVNWMRQKRTFGVNCSRGGIVFAQMGLGKTFTSLEYIRRSKEKNNLIICSKILIGEWLKQIKKFYEVQPNILVLHSDYINLKNITHQQIANADIVITTYHMLSRELNVGKFMRIQIEISVKNILKFIVFTIFYGKMLLLMNVKLQQIGKLDFINQYIL
jgi:SNF2 family DNA or RNA helicase